MSTAAQHDRGPEGMADAERATPATQAAEVPRRRAGALAAAAGLLALGALAATPWPAYAAPDASGPALAAAPDAADDEGEEDAQEDRGAARRDAGEGDEDESEAAEAGDGARPRLAPGAGGNPVERSLHPPDSRARPGRAAGLPGAR